MRKILEIVLSLILLSFLFLCINSHDIFLIAPVSFVSTQQILLLWNGLKNRKYDGTDVNASNEFSNHFDANIVELIGKVKALVNDYINSKKEGVLTQSHEVDFNNPTKDQLRSLSDGKYLCIDLSRYIDADKIVTEQLNNAFLVIKGKYSNRFKRSYSYTQLVNDSKTYDFSIWRQKLVVDTYNVGSNNPNALDSFLHSYDLTNQFEYYAFDYSSSEPDHYFNTSELNTYGLSANSYWFTDNLCIDSYLANERTKHVKSEVADLPFIPNANKRAFAYHKLIKEGVLDNIKFYDYNVRTIKILRAAEHIEFGNVNQDNYRRVFMDLLYSSMPTKTETIAGGNYKRYMYPYFYVPTVFYYESFSLDHHNNAFSFQHSANGYGYLDPLVNHNTFQNMKTYGYFYPMRYNYNNSTWVTINPNLNSTYDLFGYTFLMPGPEGGTTFKHAGFGGSFSYGMSLKYQPDSKYRYGTYFTPYYTSDYIVSGYASAAMMHFYGSRDFLHFGLKTPKIYMQNELNINGKDFVSHKTTTIPTGLMPMYQEFYPIYLIDSYCFVENKKEAILLKPPTFSRYTLTPRQYNFHFRIPFGIQENERKDNTVLKAYAQANSYYHINPSTVFSEITPTYAYFTALSDYHTMLPPFNRQMAFLSVRAVQNMNNTIQSVNILSNSFLERQLISGRTRNAILTNICNWVNYPGTYTPFMNENQIRDNYLFATSPTNIRGLLWSNVYFRKLIDPGVAHELGFTDLTLPTDNDSVDTRLRRVIPNIQPFGITNAPVRVGNPAVETPRRLWRMNIYSGAMSGNYIGNEYLFQQRAIALALMSYTLAVPDYPDASPSIPWCWQSFDSMLSYAPELGAQASRYGLGYEYRFAYFHNDIHLIPGMLLSLGSTSSDSYRLPLLTYNHLSPLFFVVLTDRNGYWQQGETYLNTPVTAMNTTNTELTYLYIVPPDYMYNLKLPGPIRSISTHRLTSESLSDVYTVARYELFAPYLPLYPYRDVNTTLPRFDIRPHLKAFNIYRDIRPTDNVPESLQESGSYRINDPNNTSVTEMLSLRRYGYYNSFLGYFFVDVGGSFTAIERIDKLLNSGYENRTIRYLVIPSPDSYGSYSRILVDISDPLWGTDFNPFYTDAGSVFLTSEVRYDVIRNRTNSSPTTLPTEQQGYVITMNGLTNLMFTYNNIFWNDGAKLWSTFDDFRSYYISNYNILTWVANSLQDVMYAAYDLQKRFFAYSVLRTIALTNRIFFPNVRIRPLLSMNVSFEEGNNTGNDIARRHIAYYKIYDDIVTKSSYYQTDLLTPMYITYNPLGAYVMVHEKDRDYIHRLMDSNVLPSTNNPNPVPLNASFNGENFYNTIYENYELMGSWNFHNLLFPTFSTGEVRQPQAWAFSHPRMWPRPIMAYYYPSRVTPNPAYYLSGIIQYEEKTYSGRRPYHVLDYRNRKDFVVVIRLYKLNDEIVAESLNNDFVSVYHSNKVYLRTKTQFIEPIVPRTLKGTGRVRHSLTDLVSNVSSHLGKFEAIVGGKVLADLVSDKSVVGENYITKDYLHPIEDGVSAGSAYYIVNESTIINCFGDIHQVSNDELAFCDRTTYPYDKDEQDIEIVVPDDYDYETTTFGWSEAVYVKFKTEDVFNKAAGKDFEVNKYKGKINIVPEHPISYGVIDNVNILKKQRDYITMMLDINYLSYDTIGSANTIPTIRKAEHLSLISNRFDNLSGSNVVYNLPRPTSGDEFSTYYQRLIFEIDLPAQTLQYSQFSDALRYGKRDTNTSYVSTSDGLSIYNNKDLANVMLHEFERFDEPMIVYDNLYNPQNVLFMFIDNLTAERANADVLNDNPLGIIGSDEEGNMVRENVINVGPNPFSGFWHMEYVGFITDYAWNKWSVGLDAEPRQGLLQNMNMLYEGFSNVYFYKVELTNSDRYGRHLITNESSVTFAQDGVTLADYIKLHRFAISALSLNAFAPFLDFAIYNNYFGGTPKTMYYSDDYTPNNLYLPSSYYRNNYPGSLNITEIRNSLYRFRVEDISVQNQNQRFLFSGKDIVTRLFSFRLPVVTNMVFVKDEIPRYRIYPTSTLHPNNDSNVYDKGFYDVLYNYDLGNVPRWSRVSGSLGRFYGSNQAYFYYNVITPATNIQNTLRSQFNTIATNYNTVEYNYDPLVTSVGTSWSIDPSKMKRLVYVVPPKPFEGAHDVFYRIGNLFAWPYDLIGANVQAECYYKNPNNNSGLLDYNLKAWYWPYIGRYAENLMHLNAQRAAFSPFTGYGYWMRYSNNQHIISPMMVFWFKSNDLIRTGEFRPTPAQIKFSVNSEYGYSYGRVVNPYKDFIAYERPYGEDIAYGYIDNSLILNKYTRKFPNSTNPTRLSVVSDVYRDNVFNTITLKTSAAIEIPQGLIYNMLISNYHPPVPLFAVHGVLNSYKLPANSLMAQGIRLRRPSYGRWASARQSYTANYVCFDAPPYGTPLGGSFYLQQYMLSNIPLYYYYNDNTRDERLFKKVNFNQELSLKHFIPPELYYLISYPIFLTNEQVSNPNLDYQYEPFYMSTAKLNLVYVGTQKFYPLVPYGIPYVKLFYPFTELMAEYNVKSITEKFSPDIIRYSKTLYKYPLKNLGYKNRGMPMYSIYIDGQYDFNHTPSNVSGNMAMSQSAMLSYLSKDDVNYNDPTYTPSGNNIFDTDFYKIFTYYDATIVREDTQFMSFLENNRSALAMAGAMNFLAGTSPNLKTSELVLRKLYDYYRTDTMAYDMMMLYFHAHDEEHTSYRLDRIGVLGHPKDQNTKVTTNLLNILKYSPNTLSNLNRLNDPNNTYTIDYYNLSGSYASTKMILERDVIKRPLSSAFGIFSNSALTRPNTNIRNYFYLTNRLIYEDLLLQSYHYRSYVPLPNEGIYIPNTYLEFNLMLNQSVSAKALFFVGNPYYIRSELANKANIYFAYNDYKVLSQFYKKAKRYRYRVRMPIVEGLRVSVGVMPLGYNATHAYSVGPAGAIGARNYSQYTDRQFGEYHLPARETTNFSSRGSMLSDSSRDVQININNVIKNENSNLSIAKYLQSPKSLFHTITNIRREERVIFWARNPYLIDVLTIYPKPLIIDPVSIYQKEALSCASLYLSDYLTYVPYGALGTNSPQAISVSWAGSGIYPDRNSNFIDGSLWPNAVIDAGMVGDLVITSNQQPFYLSYNVGSGTTGSLPLTFSFPVGAVVEASGLGYDKWSYQEWIVSYWLGNTFSGAQHLPVPRRWLNHMAMYTNTLPMLTQTTERRYNRVLNNYSYITPIMQLHNPQTFFLSMYSNPTHTMLYLSHVLGSSAYNNKVVHEMRFDMELLHNLTDTVTYNNYWPHMQHTEVNMREENKNIKKFLISPHHYYTVKALLEKKYYDIYRLNAETLINYNKYDSLVNSNISLTTEVADEGINDRTDPYYDLFFRNITQVQSLYWTKRDLMFTTTYNILDHAYNTSVGTYPFYAIESVSGTMPSYGYDWLGGLYFLLNSDNYIINHSVPSAQVNAARVQPRILIPEATYVPVFYTFNTSLSTRRLSLYRTSIFASDIEPLPVFHYKGESAIFDNTSSHTGIESDIQIANSIFTNSVYNIELDNVIVSNRMQTPFNDMYRRSFTFDLFYNTSPNASFRFNYNIPDVDLFYLEFNGFGRFEYNMNYADLLIRNPAPWSVFVYPAYWPINKFRIGAQDYKMSALKLLGDDVNMLFRFPKEMKINITGSLDNWVALSVPPLFVNQYSMWEGTHIGIFSIAVDAFSQMSYVDVANMPDASGQLGSYNILGVTSPGLAPTAFNMTYNTIRYNIWNFTHRIDYFWFSWVLGVPLQYSTARSRASMFKTPYSFPHIKQPVLRANTLSHYMYDLLYLDTGRVFIRPKLYQREQLTANNPVSDETTSDMPFFVIADAIYMNDPARYVTTGYVRNWDQELYSFDHLRDPSIPVQFYYMNSDFGGGSTAPGPTIPPGYRTGSNVMTRPYGGYDQAVIKQGTGASVANFYHLVEAEPSMTRLWSIQCGLNTAPLTRTGDELSHEYGVPVSNNHMVTSHGLHYEATITDYFLGNMFLYKEDDAKLYEGHPLPHPNFIIFGKSDNIYKFLGNPVPEVTYSAPPMSYTIELGLRLYTALNNNDGTINRSQYQDITIRPYQKHLSFSTDTSVELPHTYSYEHLLQNSCFAQHAFPAMVRNKHDIDYHHQAEYVFSNGGIFANIASSYMKAVAQNPPS